MKNKTVLYHLLFWTAIYLLWVLLFRSYSFSLAKTITVEFCYLLFITADFYALNNYIIPEFLLKKKYAAFGIITIIVIALSAWLRALVAVQMNHYFFHVAPVPFLSLYFNSLLNISVWVTIVILLKMLYDSTQHQRKVELLETEQIKRELDYLKAQINPHTLFNSLNTIYGHIDKTNDTAREILLQFSELLRYQLYECSAETTDLEKEIAYIKNFVALQQVRKNDELAVTVNTGNITKGLKITPLLLVVLIENAFKFCSNYGDKENKIAINLFTKDNLLHCSVFNTKDSRQTTTSINNSGIGIVNLKRRLELLYPSKHNLTINNHEESYEAILIINLQ